MENRKRNSSEPALHILDIIQIALRNWVWFAFSVLTFIVLGYLQTERTPFQYKANAVILISGEDESNSSKSAVFSDIGLDNTSISIDYEITMMSSSDILQSVVHKLNLNTTYSVEQSLRVIDIYNNTPIVIDWIDLGGASHTSLEVKTISTTENKLLVNGIEAIIGDTVRVNGTTFIVNATRVWGHYFVDDVITVQYSNDLISAQNIKRNLVIPRAGEDAHTIALNFVDNNAERAKDVLNTLMNTYIEKIISDQKDITDNLDSIISQRILKIRAELTGIDSTLTTIIQGDSIRDIPTFYIHNTSTILENRNKYESEIILLDIRISSIASIKSYIAKNLDNTIMQNNEFSELGIEQQIVEYNDLITQLKELQRHSGSKNPAVLQLKVQIKTLKDGIEMAIDNLLTSLHSIKSALTKQKDNLTRQIASISQQEKKTKNIRKEEEIKTELYAYLLNKRETNILNLALAESSVEVIEYAGAPKFPIFPVLKKNIMFAVAVGLAIPAMILFLISFLITTIQTKKDIEDNTDIPILGVIPRVQKTKQRKLMGIIIGKTSLDIVSEAFRLVVSNLSFTKNRLGIESEVIQITSTLPGDGKTTSSINLALSYAHVNKKTIIIDLDLRRRGLSRLLDGITHIGVSEYLAGKFQNIDDIIIKNHKGSSLDYITAGALPPNSVSLFMSKRFTDFIAELRQRYDCIILDSPPYFLTADSQVINTVVDSTIYVIRSNKVSKKILPELDILYKENKVNNISLLLTDVNLNKAKYGIKFSYGYGHSYGHNHGYGQGYGYGEKDE